MVNDSSLRNRILESAGYSDSSPISSSSSSRIPKAWEEIADPLALFECDMPKISRLPPRIRKEREKLAEMYAQEFCKYLE